MDDVLEAETEVLDSPEAVSVIICFKDELENLRAHFQGWADILGNEDELVLVNDHSVDGSVEWLQARIKDRTNVKLIHATAEVPGKKNALKEGFLAAKNPLVLLTDADGVVASDWRNRMASKFTEHKDFVLGYAPIMRRPGILNQFQRYETLLTAIQYFAYARAGIPYMGVGRNMGIRKAVFDESVYGNRQVASGDDDLLVNALGNKSNIAWCTDPDSFVYSQGKESWKGYWRQKARHVSASVAYKWRDQLLLGGFALSQVMSNGLFGVLLISSFWWAAIFLVVLKWLVMVPEVNRNAVHFKESPMGIRTIGMDFLLSGYYLILGFSFFLINRKKWS